MIIFFKEAHTFSTLYSFTYSECHNIPLGLFLQASTPSPAILTKKKQPSKKLNQVLCWMFCSNKEALRNLHLHKHGALKGSVKLINIDSKPCFITLISCRANSPVTRAEDGSYELQGCFELWSFLLAPNKTKK